MNPDGQGFTLIKTRNPVKPPGCPVCHEGDFPTIRRRHGDVVRCNRCWRAYKLINRDIQALAFWKRVRRYDGTTYTGPK